MTYLLSGEHISHKLNTNSIVFFNRDLVTIFLDWVTYVDSFITNFK